MDALLFRDERGAGAGRESEIGKFSNHTGGWARWGRSSSMGDGGGSSDAPSRPVLRGATDAGELVEAAGAQTWLIVVFVTFYGVVFLLGLFGNSLVVYVVARNRTMQTIPNIFITNLAVADVMMCLLAVPFTPISGLMRSWVGLAQLYKLLYVIYSSM